MYVHWGLIGMNKRRKKKETGQRGERAFIYAIHPIHPGRPTSNHRGHKRAQIHPLECHSKLRSGRSQYQAAIVQPEWTPTVNLHLWISARHIS